MITALSRCRSIQEAHRLYETLSDRPSGMLDLHASGLEVVSRWTDLASFNTWQSGRDLPPTLLLDAAPLLADFCCWSKTLYLLAAGLDGTILSCSPALQAAFQSPGLVGSCLWERMVESDARKLQHKIHGGNLDPAPFLCNFTALNSHPFSLQCKIDLQPGAFLLIGEEPVTAGRSLSDELLELNNLLATMTRENARQNKLLDQARQAHWHLKKIQENLPICLKCSKVKTGLEQWDPLVNYLRENSDFLSHGYCPDCQALVEQAWEC